MRRHPAARLARDLALEFSVDPDPRDTPAQYAKQLAAESSTVTPGL